jgi:hypothetical protein
MSPRAGLHLPADDPAAPAVEALRAMAERPVVASAELAGFLADPAGAGVPDPRSETVTVVRLPIRRAGRIAVATGAALAIAALGGVAVAASGGGQDQAPAVVQQDEPSDTTTTSSSTTSSSSTTEPSDTETSETTEPAETGTTEPAETEGTGTHTPNATAYANHHDGVGEDDTHADVNGGGEVDHRAEHSPTAPPTHPTAPTGVGTGAAGGGHRAH